MDGHFPLETSSYQPASKNRIYLQKTANKTAEISFLLSSCQNIENKMPAEVWLLSN